MGIVTRIKSSGRKKKKEKTGSKNRRTKSRKSRGRKARRLDAEREEKKQSTSQSGTSPNSTTPRKEREEIGSGKDKRKVPEMTVRDREPFKREEEEQKAEVDDDDDDEVVQKKKSYTILPKGGPKNVHLKHHPVQEAECSKFIILTNQRKKEPVSVAPRRAMDERSANLYDRVIKKPYPMKYATKTQQQALVDDDDYFKLPAAVQKKSSTSAIVLEDTYDHVVKLADVKTQKDEDVYNPGTRMPFWTSPPLEPDEEEMKNIEPPISVGAEHLEMYQDKKLTLKTAKETKILLDEWAPMATLQKRDDEHFHPHLVFSNTIRSLINVQSEVTHDRHDRRRNRSDSESGEEATQNEQESLSASFSKEKPKKFLYERSNPILSARACFNPDAPSTPQTSNTNNSSDSASGSDTNLCAKKDGK